MRYTSVGRLKAMACAEAFAAEAAPMRRKPAWSKYNWRFVMCEIYNGSLKVVCRMLVMHTVFKLSLASKAKLRLIDEFTLQNSFNLRVDIQL